MSEPATNHRRAIFLVVLGILVVLGVMLLVGVLHGDHTKQLDPQNGDSAPVVRR